MEIFAVLIGIVIAVFLFIRQSAGNDQYDDSNINNYHYDNDNESYHGRHSHNYNNYDDNDNDNDNDDDSSDDGGSDD